MTADNGRALVLGGGGVAGIAWESGMITGLRRAGVDLTDAEVIVGTSAGSVVGSFVAHGADLEEAIELISARPATEPAIRGTVDLQAMMTAFGILFDASLDPQDARAKVGAMALNAATDGMGESLTEIGRRLPSQEWPDRRLLVTGVDAEDGAFVVWDRESAAPLALAVAASCSVPCVFPPVAIGGHRYMDGGARSITNADLAKGSSAVVILEPMSYLTPRSTLENELRELGDARTVAIGPDQATIDIFGMNFLSPKLWVPGFAAGLAQAEAAAESVEQVWHG